MSVIHGYNIKCHLTIERKKIMKLAIPVDEKNMDTKVCISFGRTPYFMFYDTQTKQESFFDNGAISAQGGAGIKAAQMIVDNKAVALLTMRCGENAATVLNGGNVKIYKTQFETAKQNIEAFEKGELNILNDIHKGFHNHG